VYIDLKCQIMWYVETWARLCSIAYEDENYRQEKHTWIEWYEITKVNLQSVMLIDKRN